MELSWETEEKHFSTFPLLHGNTSAIMAWRILIATDKGTKIPIHALVLRQKARERKEKKRKENRVIRILMQNRWGITHHAIYTKPKLGALPPEPMTIDAVSLM